MPANSALQARLESIFQNVLDEPHLQLVLDAGWGSTQNSLYRQNIRENLAQTLRNPDFLNLAERPRSADFSISISHSPAIGGYAMIPKPQRIGFDVEVSERVSARTITRMSEPGEVALAPHPALLWAAKEAVFKALDVVHANGDVSAQPQTLSQLTLGRWVSHEKAWTFEAHVKDSHEWFQGLGAAVQDGDLSLAIFVLSPQL